MAKACRRPRLAGLGRVAPAVLALGTLSAGCEHALSSLGPGVSASDEWVRSYTVSSDGTVEISNVNGGIEVEPSSGTTVEVRAELEGKGPDEAAARQALSMIEIREEVSADRVRLQTEAPTGGLLLGRSAEVRYYVRAPATGAVTVRTVNGAVEIRGITGVVHAETTNGRIQGRELGTVVAASTTNGSIEIDVGGIGDAGIDLSTTNGRIRLNIPREAGAVLSARVGNGRIETPGLDLPEPNSRSRRRLEATLNAGGPRVQLSTSNGSITVTGLP